MKILLLGKNGQVGWELQRSLSHLCDIRAVSREEVDLEDTGKVSNLISGEKPSIVVNAAAYTAVDKAESQSNSAYSVNADAVEVMAQETNKLNAWLVHYSTDYIFDGKKESPYKENDVAFPLSIYGKSKLKGENLIREINPKHLIIRTSWVYSTRGNNFAKTILNLAKEKNELNIIDDQHGAPTSAELIADVTALAIYRIKQNINNSDLSGTYHLTASGRTSWYGFAKTLIELAQSLGVEFNTKLEDINAIGTESYPLPATRPMNSELDTTKLRSSFNVTLPNWRYHVHRFINHQVEKEAHCLVKE